MQELKESPNDSEKVQSKRLSIDAWNKIVLSKPNAVCAGRMVLFIQPITGLLKVGKVEAVMSDLNRIVVADLTSLTDKQPMKYALNYKCLSKYDSTMVGLVYDGYIEQTGIPKSIEDDPFNLSYPLYLIKLDHETELRFEAARMLPKMHVEHERAENGVSLYCLFEIIIGRVHYLTKNDIFPYNPALTSRYRRDLHDHYDGTRVTFNPNEVPDNTVIRALAESIQYRNNYDKIEPAERILSVGKHNVSFIKFGDGYSALVYDKDILKDSDPVRGSNIDDQLEQRFQSMERRIRNDTIQMIQQQSSSVNNNNNNIGSINKNSSTAEQTPLTPQLGITNKIFSTGAPIMNQISRFGSGTVAKALADKTNDNDDRTGISNLNFSPIDSNRRFNFRSGNSGDNGNNGYNGNSGDNGGRGNHGNHGGAANNNGNSGFGGNNGNGRDNDQGHPMDGHIIGGGISEIVEEHIENEPDRSQNFSLRFRISDITLRYYGRNQKGQNQDIIPAIKRWQEIVDMYQIPKEYWYRIWTNRILAGAAKHVQWNDKSHQGNIKALWQLLASKFYVPSKLAVRIHNLKYFRYTGFKTIASHRFL